MGEGSVVNKCVIDCHPKEAPAKHVPAAAVIRVVQALFGITGHKVVGGLSQVKADGPTISAFDTEELECAEVSGTIGVAVKCVDINRRPEPKAHWGATDTESRKRGEQTGLDTLVVHVNDEH